MKVQLTDEVMKDVINHVCDLVGLNGALAAMTPEDRAQALAERAAVLVTLSAEDRALALGAMSLEERTASLAALSPEDKAEALAAMIPDDRAEALSAMSLEEYMVVLEAVKQKSRRMK